MTKELAQKLIAWYEESIAMIKKEKRKNIIGILWKRGIGYGVCRCALVNFNIDLHRDYWVICQKKSESLYWGSEPNRAETKEEVIKALQLRVDILKTFDGE